MVSNNCASVILTLKSFTWYAFKRKILRIFKVVHYLLTPWSGVLETLNSLHLAKKFPTFYGTRSFIAAFTTAHHPSLPSASSIQSIPSHTTSWRSILLLSSHLRLDFQVVSFHQASPPKPYIRLSSPPYVLHAPPISLKLCIYDKTCDLSEHS